MICLVSCARQKVIGVPKDMNRFKTSGFWAGDDRCCILWPERSVFQVKLSFPDLAMLKFTVTIDKGMMGKNARPLLRGA